MNTKYYPLIRLLSNKSSWTTAANIAAALQISVRTVKNYIRDLNQEYSGIIISSSYGYRLNSQVAARVLESEAETIPQTPKERAIYIISKVLKSPVSLSIYDLCDELFISYSAFRSLLPRIRSQIENYSLTMDTTAEHISFLGSEKNKRRLLSFILYSESEENFVNLEIIQSSFPAIDIEFVRKTILDVLNESGYYINDYSLNNLLLHFAIAIDRIQIDYDSGSETVQNIWQELPVHEREMSAAIIRRLENQFQLKFSQNEEYEITLLLISRVTSVTNYKNISIVNLDNYIDGDTMALIKEMMENIFSRYGIDLYESDFLIPFALHIKSLLIRAQTRYFSKNPLTNHIKLSCPLIYDSAAELSYIIKQRTGVQITDDEIAYIAFHIGSALELQKEIATRLSVVIYSPVMGPKLVGILNSRFNTELTIQKVVTNEAELTGELNCDFIISTIPLRFPIATPYVQIQPFLSEMDQLKIKEKIAEIKTIKSREKFQECLQQLVSPQLFEYSEQTRNMDELIHYLCDKLYRQGYVEESFEFDVVEREQMSSTGFQNFAIPHSIKMDAKRTGMFIYLSGPAIEWGEYAVHLVIMLCFNNKDRHVFNEVFEPLTMALTDNGNIKKLLATKDYSDFIRGLVDAI